MINRQTIKTESDNETETDSQWYNSLNKSIFLVYNKNIHKNFIACFLFLLIKQHSFLKMGLGRSS